jgi:hypothetical protein
MLWREIERDRKRLGMTRTAWLRRAIVIELEADGPRADLIAMGDKLPGRGGSW